MARTGFSPLRDFMSLRDGMDRLFEDRWVSPGSWMTWSPTSTSYLALDVYESSDDIVVRAVVPGAEPDDIDVQFQGGVLTIRANTIETVIPDGASWLVHEVLAGEYLRQVTLPRTVDPEKARSTYEHGVLTLTLPKTADAKPKQIRIGSTPEITSGPDAA
jgi:HSP20 family protein